MIRGPRGSGGPRLHRREASIRADRPDVPHASQEALARSIARAVRQELPGADSSPDIEVQVDGALRKEARDVELRLAYLRLLAIFGLIVLVVGMALVGDGLPGGTGPWAPAALLLLWAGATALLASALGKGWYHPRLRRLVPASDALVLGGTGLLVFGLRPPDGLAPGPVAAAATLCVFLAFLGSFRLSRSGSRTASVSALGLWLLLAWLGRVGLVATVFIATVVVLTGYLGSGLARVVRRVVTEEVGRARLTQLYSQAREALKAREEVLAVVSHDLRNPLSAISMSAQFVLEVDPDYAHSRQLEAIQRSAARMDRLVQDLLDATRIEAGQLRISMEAASLDEVFRDIEELMTIQAEDHNLELVVEPVGDLPPVRMDSQRIFQVLSNLVGNALKFTPGGGRITVGARRAGQTVRVFCRDTGPGIPQGQLDDLFHALWQGDASDRRGIGLGLNIAKSIVDAHGERIGVDTSPGRGAEFWFTLQLAEQPDSRTPGGP